MTNRVYTSMDVAKRIIQLFDEAGASEEERFCIVQAVKAMIPISMVGEVDYFKTVNDPARDAGITTAG